MRNKIENTEGRTDVNTQIHEHTNLVNIYEDEIYGEKETPEPRRHFVTFSIGGEWYGVDIMDVAEVVPIGTITLLPNVPEHIAGIVNFRGNIVSITDLKKVFGLSKDEPQTTKDERRAVIIHSNGTSTGLLVDGSEESCEIPISKLEPPVSTLSKEKGDVIENQFSLNNRLVAVLNAQKVIEKTRLHA